jgi:transglutaminase-like putative cysteine protease
MNVPAARHPARETAAQAARRTPLHAARRYGCAGYVLAIVSLALSGKLPWPVVVLGALGFAAAVEWIPQRAVENDRLVRIVTTAVACGAAVVAAVTASRGLQAMQAAPGFGPVRDALPIALLVIGMCHMATWRKLRDVLSGLLVGFGLVILSAVFASSAPAGVAAIAAGVPLLVGLRLARWQGIADEAPMARVTQAGSPVTRAPIAGAPVTGASVTGASVTGASLTGASRRRPGVGATVAAVVGALLLALLLPFSKGADAVTKWASSHGLHSADGLPNADGTGPTSRGTGRANGVDSYVGGPLDLRMRGTLPNTPELLVPSDSPTLWRGSTLSAYDGTTWHSPGVAGLPQWLAIPWVRDSSVPGSEVVRARALRSRQPWVAYAPGALTSLSAPAGGRVLPWQDNTVLFVGGTGDYAAGFAPVPAVGDVGNDAATGADQTDAAYLQIPTELPQRVRDLGVQLAGGSSDRARVVRAVEAYLASHERYRLDSPVPRAGEDAVDVFLFRDHVGFCEQFASAETMLLRAAGIPARFVTGLAYGHDLGDGTREYLASDAHAWVEFWLPGTGWVSSDPTAGAALDAPRDSLVTQLRKWVESLPGGRFTVAGVLGLLAIGIALWVLRRYRRPALAPAGGLTMSYGAAADAYRRLQVRLRANGLQRLPQETVRDHAWRLRADPDLRHALTVVEEECFAAERPPEERSASAAAELDRRHQPQPAGKRG